MKKVYAAFIFLILIMGTLSVSAQATKTYSDITAYRYDEAKGYVGFNALSELSAHDGSYGQNAEYDVAFWKVTNNDGTAVLQDNEGNQIINIGTNKFEIIDAKRGIFAVGSSLSGWEDIDEEDNANFEGNFNIYSKDGSLVVSNVAKYNRFDFSNIALIQTNAAAYFLFDTDTLSVTRNLNYDKVEILNYNYVKVTNYGRYSWENKVGLFNSKGEFIVPAKYQDIFVGSYGITATDKNWNDILFDFNGNALNSSKENAQILKNGYYMVTDKDSGTKSLYDENEQLVCQLPNEVSYISSVYEDGFIIAQDENNLYGIINKSGNWTTEPQYDSITRSVYDSVSYNSINEETEYLPRTYKHYIAKKGINYGIIDENNNIKKTFVEDPIYESSGAYQHNSNYFCFDTDGKIINLKKIDYESRYHKGSDYAGLFILTDNEKYVICRDGYICSKGYDYLENLGNHVLATSGNQTGVIDINDNVIVPFDEWKIDCWDLNGEAFNRDHTTRYTTAKYVDGYFDRAGAYGLDGKELLACEYESIAGSLYLINPDTGKYQDYTAEEFSDKDYNRYVIQRKDDEKYGFIDDNFNIIVEPKYDYVEFFYDNTAVVGITKTIPNADGRQYKTYTAYGMIDVNGNEILPCQYYKIVNGPSRIIVADYEFTTCDHVWASPVIVSRWCVADKDGNFISSWKDCDMPDKYNRNCLHCSSLLGTSFNEQGYAVVGWSRNHDSEYIYDRYAWKVIIDKNGNYVTNPFWHGYMGGITTTLCDEGTFTQFDSDSTYVRMGDLKFNHIGEWNRWDGSWKEWNYGDSIIFEDGYYGLVDPLSQTILLPAFDYVAQDGSGYRDIRAISLNGQSYFYVTEEQYGDFVKVLDNKGNVVVDGNPTDIRRKYVKINGVFMDNPLLSGGTMLDIDEVLSTNYYNKSKSHSFKIRDFAKTKYDDNHIFNVQLGNVSGTTDKTGRVKISPDESGFSEVKITADGYLPLTVPSKFIQSYYNNFYMYKTDYGTEPVVHAVFYNTSNVYKPDNSSDITYYSGDTKSECVFTPIFNTNGNAIKNVKITQGNQEIDVINKSLSNIEIKNNKTYALWTGESITLKPGMEFPDIGVPIYLVITTKAGTETRIKLQLKCIEKMDEEIDVNLGEDISFTSDESKDQILGGMAFKYKLFDKLPADFKLTPIGDGSYKFKATLGVESKDKENIYETMDDYYTASKRDAYDDYEYGGKNPVQKFDNFFKKLADKNIVSKDNLPSAELGKTCAVKLFGYLEGGYNLQDDNTYKLSVSEGGMSAKFSFNADVQRQIIVGNIPCYWTAGLGFEDAITVPLYSTENGLSIPDSVDNEFDITIKGGGGVGVVDLVTLGASGEGKLAVSCTIPLSKETTQAIMNGKVNLFDYQVGVLQGSFITLETPDLQLYPEIKVLDKQSNAHKAQLSRSYANEDLVFNVEGVQLMGIDDGNYHIKHSIIADNTYTFTTPQVKALGDDKLLAVWVEDNRNRASDADRTAICYSIYDGNWSEPVYVDDDTTADFNPILKEVDESIYLIWSNSNTNFDNDESDTNKIAKSLSTSVAKWNGSSFDILDAINNEGVILNDITVIDGKEVVVWTQDKDGDLRQTSSATSLKCAEYENGEWKTDTLLENQKAIDGISAINNNGVLSIYYSQDTDGDIATIDDKEIFVYTDNKVKRITNNDVADTKPVVVGNTVYWYADSQIAYAQVGSDRADGYINADCLSDKFYVSESGQYIIYRKDNEAGKQSVYVLCNVDGIWGTPKELLSSDKYILGFALSETAEGIVILSNEVNTDGYIPEKASLDIYEIKQFGDLKIENLMYDEYSMNGEQLHLIGDLVNDGIESVNGLRAEFYNNDGALICEQKLALKILPGETVSHIFVIPASNSDSITMKVYPINFEDVNVGNNAKTVPIYIRDVSLENVEMVEVDNKFMISANVFNRGLENIDSIEVSLHKGNKNGEVIDSVIIKNIEANDFKSVDFIVNSDYSNEIVYIVCEELKNENLYGNNSEFIKLPDLTKRILMGDILEDGIVNSKDAVKLAQYLAKWDITLTANELKAADVVPDGVINSKDAVKLAQYLAKWDVSLD